MRKTLAALAAVALAGAMALGGAMGASATDSTTFETNRTVSVPAGETVTHTTRCTESSSHPEGGTVIDGRVSYNEPNTEEHMTIVSQAPSEDGLGWTTVVTNNDETAHAYLSWANCLKPVVAPPATIKLYWQLPAGETGASDFESIWPQKYLGENANSLECGFVAQWDIYTYDTEAEIAAVNAIRADGILSAGPEDAGMHPTSDGTSWGFTEANTSNCVKPPTETNPPVVPPTTTPSELAHTGAVADGGIILGSLLMGAGLLFGAARKLIKN